MLLVLLSVLAVVYYCNPHGITKVRKYLQTGQANTDILLNVNPGTLNQAIEYDLSSPTEIKMSAVDVYLAPPAGADSAGELKTIIKDHRGTTVGWTQTLSCTNFVDGANTITVNNLTVTPDQVFPIGGSDITGIVLGPPHTFVDELDVMSLANAPLSFGSGRFRITNNLLLHIDKTTIPGTYTATMTVTIS